MAAKTPTPRRSETMAGRPRERVGRSRAPATSAADQNPRGSSLCARASERRCLCHGGPGGEVPLRVGDDSRSRAVALKRPILKRKEVSPETFMNVCMYVRMYVCMYVYTSMYACVTSLKIQKTARCGGGPAPGTVKQIQTLNTNDQTVI